MICECIIWWYKHQPRVYEIVNCPLLESSLSIVIEVRNDVWCGGSRGSHPTPHSHLHCFPLTIFTICIYMLDHPPPLMKSLDTPLLCVYGSVNLGGPHATYRILTEVLLNQYAPYSTGNLTFWSDRICLTLCLTLCVLLWVSQHLDHFWIHTVYPWPSDLRNWNSDCPTIYIYARSTTERPNALGLNALSMVALV